MLRHVDVDDPPSIVGEDDEHEEHAECYTYYMPLRCVT
jgi:hypothetical protein